MPDAEPSNVTVSCEFLGNPMPETAMDAPTGPLVGFVVRIGEEAAITDFDGWPGASMTTMLTAMAVARAQLVTRGVLKR
ncbi:MAG TPA: hypothetical protein VF937_04155 [Chloroflexota bacterium]